MVSHDLLKRFSAGFQRFQKTWYCPENNIYEDLRVGQHPYALVIACSDSRVDPVLLLDATPGDLFVIRNVANLVPPYEPDSHHHGVSAALEYAVRHLHIGHIMVMGHAKCGGFTSLLEASHSDDEFLNIWMNLACRAKAEVDSSLPGADPDERQRACEMWGVRFSLDNLMGYPWIKSAVDAPARPVLRYGLRRTALLRRGKRNLCADGQCLRFRHLICEEAIEDWKLGKEDGLFLNEKPSPFPNLPTEPIPLPPEAFSFIESLPPVPGNAVTRHRDIMRREVWCRGTHGRAR